MHVGSERRDLGNGGGSVVGGRHLSASPSACHPPCRAHLAPPTLSLRASAPREHSSPVFTRGR